MCDRQIPRLPLSRGDTATGQTREMRLKVPVALFDEISAMAGKPRALAEVTRGLILRGLEHTNTKGAA